MSDYPHYLTSSPYCKELNGTGVQTFSRDGASAKVILLALWDNRFDAAPAYGSVHPLDSRLRASNIVFTPYPGTTITSDSSEFGGHIQYEYCQIDVTYDTSYIIVGDLPVESVRLSAMMLEIGVGRTWLSDHAESEQPQAIPVSTMEYAYRSKFWDAGYAAQLAIVESKVNCINSGTFKGKAAGTFLFSGWQADSSWQQYAGSLIRVWDCSYVFQYKSDGFNSVWRASTAAYDSFDQPLYSSVDFSTLTV